jgi:plasmid stabilization system protein ParE
MNPNRTFERPDLDVPAGPTPLPPIAQDNSAAARRGVERLRKKARTLSETAAMRRSREDLRPGLFSFPVGKHVLFYRVQPGGIVLARHPRRVTCQRSLAPPSLALWLFFRDF